MTSVELKFFHTELVNTKNRERQMEEDARDALVKQSKEMQIRSGSRRQMMYPGRPRRR